MVDLNLEREALQRHFRQSGPLFYGLYPIQLAAPPRNDPQRSRYIGELRGFYPRHDPLGSPVEPMISNGYFGPWNSFLHYAPNEDGVHRGHGGCDVYTGYTPFPFEVGVRALVGGTLTLKTAYQQTTNAFEEETINGQSVRTKRRKIEELGNRIAVEFDVTVGTRVIRYRLDYGHLNRFAPAHPDAPAGIKQGELIGFAGKSGNADERGDGRTLSSPFRVNAGHVHLALVRLSGPADASGTSAAARSNKVDLYAVLPRKLGYHPEHDELGYGNAANEKRSRPTRGRWIVPPKPALKRDFERPQLPIGSLAVTFEPPAPRRSEHAGNRAVQRRAIMPAPFHALDFDNLPLIETTRNAYGAMRARFEAEAVTNPTTAVQREAKAEAADHIRDGARRFASLTSTAPAENDVTHWGETVGALVARARGRWTTLGENALERPAKVLLSFIHLGEALYILMGGPALEALARSREQVACGISVRGQAVAVAWENAVVAAHITTIEGDPPAGGGEVPRFWVGSITLGNRSLRHATVPMQALGTDAAINAYLQTLANGFHDYYRAIRLAITQHQRIAGGDAEATARLVAAFDAIATRLLGLASTINGGTEAVRIALMKALVYGNFAAFTKAAAIAANETPVSPVAPQLEGLHFQPPIVIA
ncbi:hypothetical protein [Bradyrhizobium diversitatis]|uniref:Uncharacterized protein n=1 Tax=Bradyrhizobium diversitatis TaxID=2755406 RepID=A0ABS0P0A0_9BRAD|nr:hypothetical protein [Bradyrhizobium diversitatis]MBH5386663.1 hypothetical protein [Bradyrhizobium diversitatis]